MINTQTKKINEVCLQDNAIDLYFISVKAWKKNYKALWQVLSLQEKARASRFHFEVDKESYVVAHAVKRLLLSHILGIDAVDLLFNETDSKKPYIINFPLYFNLSHSGEWILIGISKQADLGVDIERIEQRDSEHDIVKRFFTGNEYQAYQLLKPEEKHLGFFLAWTQKEAIVKAIGMGIAFGFDKFEVNLNPNEPTKLIKMHENKWEDAWNLYGGLFTPEYAYAVAWYQNPSLILSEWQLLL